jgi:mRNA interferase MazF
MGRTTGTGGLVKAPYIPERGDLVWTDFNPQAGREQAGKRPALVISPKIYDEKTGLAVMVPITSHVKGYPFEVAVNHRTIKGVVLADHLKNMDWKARGVTFAAKASGPVMDKFTRNIAC